MATEKQKKDKAQHTTIGMSGETAALMDKIIAESLKGLPVGVTVNKSSFVAGLIKAEAVRRKLA